MPPGAVLGAPERRRVRLTPESAATPLPAVVVAVPARNEAANIHDCLAAIDAAAARCGYPVTTVVTADSCTDLTAQTARRYPAAHMSCHVIEGHWGTASGARRAAVEVALTGRSEPSASTWIANTDADCAVDPDWLVRQLDVANQNIHAVAGIVQLNPHTTPPLLLSAFEATYRLDRPTHSHVHAANLGIRADTYRKVGGWNPHVALGEEHDLWSRVRRHRVAAIQSTDVVVVTSSRTVSRVHGGFADDLARLERGGVTLNRSRPAAPVVQLVSSRNPTDFEFDGELLGAAAR